MTDTSRSLTDLHPELVKAWLWARQQWADLYPHKPQPFITCTHRGPNDQAQAVMNGFSQVKYPDSKHNKRPALAFDIAFAAEGGLDWGWQNFSLFAELLKPHGIVWGGDWPMRDGPHFEAGADYQWPLGAEGDTA